MSVSIGILAYLTLVILFCATWARALPPPQNTSKAIVRSERLRVLRLVLGKAFAARRANADVRPLLKKLDRVALTQR